jgi:hypothetical protein
VRPFGVHSNGWRSRSVIGLPALRGHCSRRGSASGKRVAAAAKARANSGRPACGGAAGTSGAFGLASRPSGAIIHCPTAGSAIIAPVSSDSASSGAVITPRSRWWWTIAPDVIFTGHSRGRNRARIRHHSTTPLITKNSPTSATMPSAVSPASPSSR